MARKLLKAGWIQLISALRPVMGYRQCLLLEQMISEMIVVTAMAVNVYVRLRQEMMETVTWMITKAIVCTNSDNLVNNNFKMYFFTEHVKISNITVIYTLIYYFAVYTVLFTKDQWNCHLSVVHILKLLLWISRNLARYSRTSLANYIEWWNKPNKPISKKTEKAKYQVYV